MRQLGQRAGIYFGTESGLPGVHPRGATLISEPSWLMRVYGEGIDCQPLDAWGEALLALPQVRDWIKRAQRVPMSGNPGSDRSADTPLDLLKSFCLLFEPSRACLMAGALNFSAYRLASREAGGAALGLMFGAASYLERGADDRWTRVRLTLAGDSSGNTRGPSASSDRRPDDASPERRPVARDERESDDLPPGHYARMVERALVALRDPALVSLTLSQSYRRRIERPPIDAFLGLREANPTPACFFVNDGLDLQLLGASPDLQLQLEGRRVRTTPVCGTVARGDGSEGLAASIRELLGNPVDSAALTVCSDALRTDLAPFCEPGSLHRSHARQPMALATVVHAVDVIDGRLQPGVHAWDLIAATAAPVMVTGTPRAAALAAINALEPSPRGWYGGQVVRIDCDGDASSGTILRAAAVRSRIAEVRAGGDLLADSDPAREEAESRLKTRSLWRAFGLEATPDRPTVAHSAGSPRTDSGPTARPRQRRSSQVALSVDAASDPFGAGLIDCVLGLGASLSRDLPDLRILAGPGLIRANASGLGALAGTRIIAIGEAAIDLLAASGEPIAPSMAMHGRVIDARSTERAPWQRPGQALERFECAIYLGRQLAVASDPNNAAGPDIGDRWTIWAEDDTGRPLAMIHNQQPWVCLLFRPDSLASAECARQALGHAIEALSPRP